MKKVTVLAVFFGVTALICAVQASVAYVVNSGIYYRGDFIDDPVLILLPGQQGRRSRGWPGRSPSGMPRTPAGRAHNFA